MTAGLLLERETRNCWTLAEALGHPDPHRLQHLLSRARFDYDHARKEIARLTIDRESRRLQNVVHIWPPCQQLLTEPQSVRAHDKVGWHPQQGCRRLPQGSRKSASRSRSRFHNAPPQGRPPPHPISRLPPLDRHSAPGVELVVIKELLGHAHILVTATVYAHVRLRLQHDAIDTLSTALGSPGYPKTARSDGNDRRLAQPPSVDVAVNYCRQEPQSPRRIQEFPAGPLARSN
ncbi:hypothetical protein [Streptomyces sp. TR06-5]|uniref:hypothetical protein n=1 Tax=Streptomyces sp. TR06-5 TaxID=3385976 RepID=UPI0039A3ECDC